MGIEHGKDWSMYPYLKFQYKNISMFVQFSFKRLLSRGEFEKTIASSITS